MVAHEEARALLQQHLSVLAPNRTGDDLLTIRSRFGSSVHFLPKQTWITADVSNASAPESLQLRALIEVVGLLNQSAGFQWREFYHLFWKSALMDPLACYSCRASVWANPETIAFDSFEQLMGNNAPRFILDFSERKHNGDPIELLRSFLLQGPRQALGESYEKLREKLAVQEDQVLRSRRVELGIAFSKTMLVTSFNFRELGELLENFAELERTSDPDQNAPRFEITTLWIPSEKLLVPVEIDILMDIIETSAIRHLHIGDTFMMLSVTKRLQVFQQLLRATVCSLPDTEPSLQTLHLEEMPLVNPPVASICSALRYPSSLKELRLVWTTAEAPTSEKTKLMWAWIAFGIFHPDSQARLNRLNLSGLSLTAGDLEAFALILGSPHPSRQLWLLEHGELTQSDSYEEIPMPPGHRVFAKLAADTKMRAGPNAKAKVDDHDVAEAEELEVAIMLSSWVCVVVAGCGLRWVPSTSVVSRREVPSKCRVLPDPDQVCLQDRSPNWPLAGENNVKCFDRNFVGEVDKLKDIKLLLRMIGHCLEGLNYPDHKVHITNSDLEDILHSCPKLTHLNLNGNALTEIRVLVDRFESQLCRIVFLNVHSTWRHPKLLFQLSDFLASPASKSLKFVGVSGFVDTDNRWAKLEKGLKRNRWLEVLFLYSPNGKHTPLLRKIKTKFEQGTITPSPSTSAKIAFLSVIKPRSKKVSSVDTSSRSTSLGKLDSKIISQIFGFAGMRMPRVLLW